MPGRPVPSAFGVVTISGTSGAPSRPAALAANTRTSAGGSGSAGRCAAMLARNSAISTESNANDGIAVSICISGSTRCLDGMVGSSGCADRWPLQDLRRRLYLDRNVGRLVGLEDGPRVECRPELARRERVGVDLDPGLIQREPCSAFSAHVAVVRAHVVEEPPLKVVLNL